MNMQSRICWLAAALCSVVSGFRIKIDANEEQCFFEHVTAGAKMSLMFEVFELSEGGFFDIDVKIVGPDNKEIYRGERKTSDKYTFTTHMDGVYKYCFNNKMSTMRPKVVMFDMEVLDPSKRRNLLDPSQGAAEGTGGVAKVAFGFCN